MRADIGDQLKVVNGRERLGLIIGVPHADGSPPYVVKWLSDGHIAMVFPSQYARIIPAMPEPGQEHHPGQEHPPGQEHHPGREHLPDQAPRR